MPSRARQGWSTWLRLPLHDSRRKEAQGRGSGQRAVQGLKTPRNEAEDRGDPGARSSGTLCRFARILTWAHLLDAGAGAGWSGSGQAVAAGGGGRKTGLQTASTRLDPALPTTPSSPEAGGGLSVCLPPSFRGPRWTILAASLGKRGRGFIARSSPCKASATSLES